MVFKADAAFALELLALIAATGLLLWAKKNEGAAKGFALVVAYFSLVAAILTMLCTSYYSMRYWEDGWFSDPMPYHHGMKGGMGGGASCDHCMMGGGGMMGGPGMKGGRDGSCPYMEQKMQMMHEKMEMMEPEGDDDGKTQGTRSDDG